MSCAQVMYQPYASYLCSYDRVSNATASATVTTGGTTIPHLSEEKKYKPPSIELVPYASRSTTPASGGECATDKDSDSGDPEHKGAQYVSANCVVFTHYSGDVSSVVDEHFSRALSQSAAFADQKGMQGKAGSSSPMSSRNFPPSFWNSNYQSSSSRSTVTSFAGYGSSSGSDMFAGVDPYHHALHGLQTDPWHYSAYSHHRGVADLSGYAGASSARFNPQYSSFLLQPPAPRLNPAQCTVKPETWAGTARYPGDPLTSDLAAHHAIESNYAATHAYGNMPASLETPIQEPGKDLYWF